MRIASALLLMFILCCTGFASDYTIETFCTNTQQIAPSSNDIITTSEGNKLSPVDVYYKTRQGELLLRRGFGDGGYCIYKGTITPTAAAGELELNRFDFPEGMSMTIALSTKFYNSKSANVEHDIKSVFFNDAGIYVDLAARIYYKPNGNWHDLGEKKSTWLVEHKEPDSQKKTGNRITGYYNEGVWAGEIEWTTLNSVNKVEGSLSGGRIIFKETDYIKKGRAILGSTYSLDLEEGKPRLVGSGEGSGRSWPVTIELPNSNNGWSPENLSELFWGLDTLEGMATNAWPFRLRITSFNPSGNKDHASLQNPEPEIRQEQKPELFFYRSTTGIGVTLGCAYVRSGLTASVNARPDTIFAHGIADSVVWGDYSGLSAPEAVNGFNVFVCFGNRFQLRLMFEGLYSPKMAFNCFGLDFGYQLSLIKDKLYLPVGIGASLGELGYQWGIASQYESMARNITVAKATTSGRVYRTEIGITGYCGLYYRIGDSGVHLFSELVYQYMLDESWGLWYKTNNKDEGARLDVPEKYLPYNNPEWGALKLRAGLTFEIM